MEGNSLPLATVAIPLYKSRPFVDTIIKNVLSCDYPNTEFIISDRHCLDDAIPVLREKLAGCNIRFLEATDRLSWVEHYNFLLREGRGKYFMWMPHDDWFEAKYVSKLVAGLEKNPDAILAFGHLDCHNTERPKRLPAMDQLLANLVGEDRVAVALRILVSCSGWVAFRGIFRRDVVVDKQLFIKQPKFTHAADLYWTFATALCAPWDYHPDCRCEKLFYPQSTSAQWRYNATVTGDLSAFFVLRSYIRDYCETTQEIRYATRKVFCWTLLKVAGRLPGAKWVRSRIFKNNKNVKINSILRL